LRSSCTEGSVAAVGLYPNNEKHVSVSQAQSSWMSVSDEAACQPSSWERAETATGGRGW